MMTDQININLLPYQIKALKTKAKYIGFIGGTGSGKTYLIPRWLYIMMNLYPGEKWIVSSPTNAMLFQNPWTYCEEFFTQNKIPYIPNKSTPAKMTLKEGRIFFISASDPDRMQGIHAKGVIGDEAGQYPIEWWYTALQRVSYRKGKILLVTTPYTNNWLKKNFLDKVQDDPKYISIMPKSIDNPYFSREEYVQAKKDLPDWKFRMMYHAEFTKPEGLVYPDYEVCSEKYAKNPKERELFKAQIFDYYDQLIAGVDFGKGGLSPYAWVLLGISGNKIEVIDEAYQSGIKNRDFIELVNQKLSHYHSLVKSKTIHYCDSEDPEKIIEWKEHGYSAMNSYKNIIAGIETVQKCRLIIHDQYCINFHREIEGYIWDMDKVTKEKYTPIKVDDHLMDCMRYAIKTHDRRTRFIENKLDKNSEISLQKNTLSGIMTERRGTNGFRR